MPLEFIKPQLATSRFLREKELMCGARVRHAPVVLFLKEFAHVEIEFGGSRDASEWLRIVGGWITS